MPPQDAREVLAHMQVLEIFINDDQVFGLDPLIKMAIIHHQFESIQPFSDGNGRIGRILNVLYLTKSGLLDIPVLYLSRSINSSKMDYYRLLQHVRDSGQWEEWLIYMIGAVAKTAKETLGTVRSIGELMRRYKNRLRSDLPRIYSQDLLNNLFRHPSTCIELLEKDLQITRQTAAKYLDQVAGAGLLEKHRKGRVNYYINTPL